MRLLPIRRVPAWPAALAALLLCWAAAGPAQAIEVWSSWRDAFPVFNDPPVIPAAQAEAEGVVSARDMVIGVALGGAARAYPIAIMGVHELGNDTLGGVPIAVSW